MNPDSMQRQLLLGKIRSAATSIMPLVIGILTLVLTFYLAFQSSELHKAELSLREYQDWWGEQPREKLYNAWKMFRYERVLNIQTPPLTQLDQYQKLVDDAKRLVEKGGAIQTLLLESSVMRYVPPVFEEHGPDWLTNFARTVNGNAAHSFDQIPNYGELAPGNTKEGGVVTFNCDEGAKPLQEAKSMSKAMPIVSTKDVVAYLGNIDCFLKSLNISAAQASYSPWSTIYQTKEKVNLLVVWLLPGLYGLLGACVYIMRRFVFVSDANASTQDTTLLSILSLMLRIALGGLAGIIIGWFWVPGATNGNSTAVITSSIPFGLAFLAGFSIENLFSLLDRLNQSVGQKDVSSGGK